MLNALARTCLFASIFSANVAAGGVLDPALAARMDASEPDALIDAYVVLEDQMTLSGLEDQTRGLGPRARRAVVRDRLKAHAAISQAGLRAFLDGEVASGRADDVRVLWVGNALLLRAAPETIAKIADWPGVNRVRVDDDLPAAEMQDWRGGGYPFADDFESGTLQSWWTAATTGTGIVTVASTDGPIGNFHLLMASSVDASDSTASITVSLDLAGQTNVGIRFEFKEFSDEANPEDGVFVSADGVQFFPVLSLAGSSSYATKAIDLDAAIANLGLSYTTNFHVRFQWADNYAIPTDGFAFDDIVIAPGVGDPPPSVPEPNIVLLQAPQLWDLGIDGQGLLIGNIDSGTDWSHPDLASRIWNNPGEIAGNLIDDDNNGFVDDIQGWNFQSNDNDPSGSGSHGTQTAGLMVGDGTNGRITGMAPAGTLIALQIGGESDYWLAQQYCLDVGVDVISSSYSFKWPSQPDYHMHRQICSMELAAGIIHANSIGNQGNSTTTYPIPFNISAPGICPQPWGHPDAEPGGRTSVLGCAGIHVSDDSLYTPSGQGPSAWEDLNVYTGYPHSQDPTWWDYPVGGFSGVNRGLMKPDVATYTDPVISTTFSAEYANFGGTSAATPQLGGAMMLLRQTQPEALPRHIAAAIELTAEDLGPPGKDTRYGAGKLQVYDAARRLVTLCRIDDPNPALGQGITIDLFGEPNAQLYGFISAAIQVSPTQFNLTLPFVPLGVFGLGAAGQVSIPATVPNLPALSGAALEMQFGGVPVIASPWGGADLWSVPERVAIQ